MEANLYTIIIIATALAGIYSLFSLRDIFRTKKRILSDFQEISTRNKMTLEILNSKTRNHHDECNFHGTIRRHHGLDDVHGLITENTDTVKNYLLISHLT